MKRGFAAALVVLGVALSGCGDGLSSAVISGDVAALRELLDDGADPDEVISFRHPNFAGGRVVRRRVLVAAAVHGNLAVAEMLIGGGRRSRILKMRRSRILKTSSRSVPPRRSGMPTSSNYLCARAFPRPLDANAACTATRHQSKLPKRADILRSCKFCGGRVDECGSD